MTWSSPHLCTASYVVKAVIVILKTGWNCGGQTDEEDCLLQHILEFTMNSYTAENLNTLI